MRARWIWATAFLLYGAFSLWYNNLGGALTGAEIDDYLARFEAFDGDDPERLATLRAFLEEDEGGEFYMVNLIRLHDGAIPRPGSGELQPAPEILAGYTDHFMPDLFARAGHPAFLARAAGGYLEHWGVEADPGWSFAGVIRYRSRRDLMELATDPRFEPAHVYKLAAMASTLAFPATPGLVVFGPRVWMAFLLSLLAALVHLGALARRTAARDDAW